MIKKIIWMTLIVSVVLAGITYIIFQDVSVSLGIIIGSISRLAGLKSIVKLSQNIEDYTHPEKKATQNYMGRFLFYGIVIWICISRNINIIGLTIGFIIMNVVMIIVASRKEDE